MSWKRWLALLALVGVVLLVGVASYDDDIHRSQASEAVSLLKGATIRLAEDFVDHKKWPARLEEVTANTSGKYTHSVAISKGAGGTGEIELTATMRTEGVDKRVAGTTILMVSSDGGKNWLCKTGTILAKNVSASCRN